MEWLKKHADTVVTLAAILSSVLWMNGQFADIDKKFSNVEKDIAIIKTVLIMKNIMPTQLAEKQVGNT